MSEKLNTGPWQSEPAQFDGIDADTGLPISLRRGPFGAWCGYIGVPDDHPWHGKHYNCSVPMPEGWADEAIASIDEIGIMNIFCAAGSDLTSSAPINLLVRCHGGLSFSGAADWLPLDQASWWFGFDCSHAGDFSPGLSFSFHHDVYRTFEFTLDCARQAALDIALFLPGRARNG